MTKICTSIIQSKKLIELGVDMTTADMYWFHEVADMMVNYEPRVITLMSHVNENIPAWSLSALVKMLPKGFLLMDAQGEADVYSVWVPGFNDPHIWKNNPLDACFEMICWLLENKKI